MLPPLWDTRLPRRVKPLRNCAKWCVMRCVATSATVFPEKCLRSFGFISCGMKFWRRENSTRRSRRRFGQGLARFGLSIRSSGRLAHAPLNQSERRCARTIVAIRTTQIFKLRCLPGLIIGFSDQNHSLHTYNAVAPAKHVFPRTPESLHSLHRRHVQ